MKKMNTEKLLDFFGGKGFYIVLFLCVAAIGISGYLLLFSNNGTGGQSLSATDDANAAGGAATVVVTAAPTAAPPTVAPAPTPVPTAKPSKISVTPAVVVWPLRGEIITAFSVTKLQYNETMDDWRTHGGIDIAAALGTEVTAASSGTVLQVISDPLMGTTVVIDHGSGVTTVYANLQATPTVEASDHVSAGDVIGAVGNTAIAECALASHLHFELRKDGVAADPMEYLPER
ncbi:M23 family metallopeptidase [Papillibacter cinnamivorans]|uniref:Peptidase family M23 n=1 Tax=Papillibacter cinnamivorans DSM 12816 TaxID=1122930 RepID=A0A1W2A7S6_9FIRM|nr:M23 family metallopeptidase [Papillibacter cinnamivorans]SMC56471.1 Peptidase family M23 [Papillibacter cinnamivorans DSM 12816]